MSQDEPPRPVDAWVALGRKPGEGMRWTAPLREHEPAPLTVLMHGLCNDPQVTCGWFRELGTSWQVCPAGPVSCGWGYQWAGGPEKSRQRVAASVERAREELGARLRADGAVLVGFSMGAMGAVEVVRTSPGMFVGLVLVGARVTPRASDLRAAGVRRVALAAGDFDGAAGSMRAVAASLSRAGIDARYVSLGKVGHFIPDSTSAPIAELIAWAREVVPSGGSAAPH